MSTPLTASAIVTALRAEGCKVVEYRDWRTHSRNHKGPWGPVYGVEIHHTVTTGTDASVRLCYDGYSSLPGPLCHSVGAKDGRIFMVGHGRTNHAGLGDDDVLRAVRAEAPLPPANEANTDGNRHFYGIELVNLGDGKDPWPEEQVDAAARWAAALCRAHGWNERSVIGHKEWQPGKIDPRFDMGAFRARVRRLLATPPGGPTAPPAATPPPDTQHQEESVPGYLSLGATKPYTLEPGAWSSPAFDTEWADEAGLHGAGARAIGPGFSYSGYVHVRLSGLTPGREVQVRTVEDTLDGKEKATFPIGEGVGTEGDTFLTMPICGKCGGDERLRVEIAQFGDNPVTVKRVELKAQVWKH